MHFIVSILTRHVEAYGLDEVGQGLLDALAHRNGESVLIEKVDDGHEELAVVNFTFDAEEDEGQAVADIDDVGVVGVLLVELLESNARALSRNPVFCALHLVK